LPYSANKDAGGIVLLKTYEEYYNGYDDKGEHKPGYAELIATLTTQYPLGQPIQGEEAEKDLSGYMEQYSGSEIFLLPSMTLKETRFYPKGIFRTIRAFILTCIKHIERC